MPRRLFEIFSYTIAAALILERSGSASSRPIIATVKTLSRQRKQRGRESFLIPHDITMPHLA